MVLSSLIENNKKAFFVYEFWETVLQKKKRFPFCIDFILDKLFYTNPHTRQEIPYPMPKGGSNFLLSHRLLKFGTQMRLAPTNS